MPRKNYATKTNRRTARIRLYEPETDLTPEDEWDIVRAEAWTPFMTPIRKPLWTTRLRLKDDS
jgi:hypothetical protein